MTTGKWETIADLNTARALFSVVVFDGALHALGGYIGNTKKRTRTIERYDAKANKWSVINERIPLSIES